MSGSGTSLGHGFGFSGPTYAGQMKAPPYLRGFGAEYPVYPEVRGFQQAYNRAVDELGSALGSKIKVDGKYGRQTHNAIKSWVNYAIAHGTNPTICTGDASCVDMNGPICVAGCLDSIASLSSSSIGALQTAFNWWQDLHTSHPADAERHDQHQESTTDEIPAPVEESGFPWGILAIIGLVAAGGYFMIQK